MSEADADLTNRRIEALLAARKLPGSPQKRFIRDMARRTEPLTPRQAAYVGILAWTYRKQIPAALVPPAKPGPLPPR